MKTTQVTIQSGVIVLAEYASTSVTVTTEVESIQYTHIFSFSFNMHCVRRSSVQRRSSLRDESQVTSSIEVATCNCKYTIHD